MIMQINSDKPQKGVLICVSCSMEVATLSDRGLCDWCKGGSSYYPVIEDRKAPQPTDAMPGSPEKVAVLLYREENGYELWHPDDEHLTDIQSWAHLRQGFRGRTQKQGMRDRSVRGRHDPWASICDDDNKDETTNDNWE